MSIFQKGYRECVKIVRALQRLIFIKLADDYSFVMWSQKRYCNRQPNLDKPKTFTDKMLWRMLYDRQQIYSDCTDKYKVRDYVKKKIGDNYLKRIFWITENPKNIEWEKLPKKFMIKPNHASGLFIAVFDKSDIDVNSITEESFRWMKINHYDYAREWQYRNIKPLIMIEELIIDNSDEIIQEWKIYCFHGVPEIIVVTEKILQREQILDYASSVYDRRFHPLPVFSGQKAIPEVVIRHEKTEEIIEMSSILSADFDHVRVDILVVGEEIYFGELTFTSMAGRLMFNPPQYDKVFGEKWRLVGKRKTSVYLGEYINLRALS